MRVGFILSEVYGVGEEQKYKSKIVGRDQIYQGEGE